MFFNDSSYSALVEVRQVCGHPFNATFEGQAINLNESDFRGKQNVYSCKNASGMINQLGCYQGFLLVGNLLIAHFHLAK